ncbi:hypothetical protein pEaSNUABM40_00192 [Erwinia phage pEa_SNUABM_40]|nr:hypothetical protein pEaSNUABM40_00192 [Erwinia phage pEa_SNUABM_40]
MEIQVSLSALPPSIYRKYRKGWKPNPTLLSLFEKISGKKGHKAMRIYIDAKSDNVIKNVAQNVKPPIQIVDALMEKDMVLVDYLTGTAKDSHGRIVKIGRVLSKNAELKKMFDSDPNRKSIVNATRNRQLICISMHPYDIAGMSTDRGWVSCMNVKTGSNKKYVKQDIAGGTLIAYLIDPADKNINKPIGRCLAKPYFERTKVKAADKFVGSEKVNALYLVEFAYPDSKMPFVHVLQEWLDEHINPFIATTERKGMYELSSKLYPDRRWEEFDYDLESPMLHGDVNAFIKRLTATKNKEAEDVALSYIERYPSVAVALAREKWGQPKFYVRSATELLVNKHYREFGDFIDIVFGTLGVDDPTTLMLWEKMSSRPRAMAIFIDKLPRDRRQNFLDANLGDVDFYSNREDSLHNWSYPAALSQIWSFVKYTNNPESAFWYNASRINTGDVQTKYVDEEYELGDSYRAEYVLAPAIGSLANMSPFCPAATLVSLERNKNSVDDRYYECAKKVFDGWKYVAIDPRRDFRSKLRAMLERKEHKFKKTEIHTLIYRIDIDDELCIGQAREELYPNAEMLSRSGNLIVQTTETPEQVIEAICDRALELALAQAKEEVVYMREEAKARRKRLAAMK